MEDEQEILSFIINNIPLVLDIEKHDLKYDTRNIYYKIYKYIKKLKEGATSGIRQQFFDNYSNMYAIGYYFSFNRNIWRNVCLIKLTIKKEEIKYVKKDTYKASSYTGFKQFRFKIIAKIYMYFKSKKGYEVEEYEE